MTDWVVANEMQNDPHSLHTLYTHTHNNPVNHVNPVTFINNATPPSLLHTAVAPFIPTYYVHHILAATAAAFQTFKRNETNKTICDTIYGITTTGHGQEPPR